MPRVVASGCFKSFLCRGRSVDTFTLTSCLVLKEDFCQFLRSSDTFSSSTSLPQSIIIVSIYDFHILCSRQLIAPSRQSFRAS